MSNYKNNDLQKPFTLVISRKPDVELTQESFRKGNAGIVGGYDTREEAEAALAEWRAEHPLLDENKEPHKDFHNLRGAVADDPYVEIVRVPREIPAEPAELPAMISMDALMALARENGTVVSVEDLLRLIHGDNGDE